MTAKTVKPKKATNKKMAKKKAPGKRGRPSAFTQKIADKICEDLSLGKSLISICEKSNMPSQAMVFRWLNDETKDTFREAYARAREAQATFHVDEMMKIADNGSTDQGQVQRDKLKIDTRKWIAAKQNAKKFGDRQHHEHSIDENTAHILSEGRLRAADRRRPES